MNESIRSKSQVGTLESHICGLMVVFTFFGEHFKIMGIPLYIFPLIICILLLLVDNHFKIRKPRGLQFSRIETFSVVLILFATITIPFSLRSVGSQPYIKTVVTALIMLVVAKNIIDEESFELILKYVLVGIIITVAASGYELLTGHHFFAKVLTNERLLRMGRGNAFGFQINVNDNASLMALSIFITIMCLRSRKINYRIIIIGIAVALLIITSMIDARLPILALFAVAVEYVILLVVSKHTRGNVSKVVIAFILIASCLIFFSVYTFSGVLTLLSNDQSYQYDAARVYFITSSLKTITPMSLLFGHGCGITQELIGGYSIHSVLIELLCDNGIVAAFCFVGLIIRLQFSFADQISRQKGMFIACFATAFILISFCSSSMLRIRSIWVYFALICRYYSLSLYENSDQGT